MHATEELRILIRTIVDQSGLQRTQQSLRGVQEQTQAASRSGASSLLAFGAAAGVSAKAVDVFSDFVGDSINAVRDHERIMRATTASYGQQTAAWLKFAAQLSATSGETSDAILEAALSARTLSQNYGLSIEQTQKLIAVSADLARIRGIGIAEAFERVQSAIRGEAEASEYLGLSLGETYMQNQALNGSLKSTWQGMTDNEKSQQRFNELLKQSADFAGLASTNTNSLDGAFTRAGKSAHDLQISIGELIKPEVIAGLTIVADLLNLIRPQPGMGAVGGVIGKTSKELQDAIRERTGGGGTGGFLGPGDAGVQPFDTAAAAKRIKDAAEAAVKPGVTVIGNALADLKENADSVGRAALAAGRQAAQDQVNAAVRDLVLAQYEQTRLQRESVDLAAEEARIKLSMLPAQQEMARLQRDITEQQVRAQMAALPATEHLEDLQFELRRAQLIVQQRRGFPLEDRRAAMRRIIELGRGEMAAAELGALEASRGVTLAGRDATRVGLQAQLMDIGSQRALADIAGAITGNSLAQAIAEATVQGNQQLVQDIVNAFGNQQVRVNVNVTLPNGSVVSYDELVDANNQSQTPPIIPQSGVRRGGPS